MTNRSSTLQKRLIDLLEGRATPDVDDVGLLTLPMCEAYVSGNRRLGWRGSLSFFAKPL